MATSRGFILSIRLPTSSIAGANLINRRCYVGFTSKKNPMHRWSSHVSCAKSESSKRTYIQRAIRKYGKDNFEFQVIYQSKDFDRTLNVMEPFFILQLSTLKPSGYNVSVGGDKTTLGAKHSEETKQKVVQSRLGRKHSEETKIKMSASAIQSWTEERREKARNNRLGYKVSEETKRKLRGREVTQETRQKMSESLKGRQTSEETRHKRSIAMTGKKLNVSDVNRKAASDRAKERNKPNVQCIHCRALVSVGTLGKWHGQKCKSIDEKPWDQQPQQGIPQ